MDYTEILTDINNNLIAIDTNLSNLHCLQSSFNSQLLSYVSVFISMFLPFVCVVCFALLGYYLLSRFWG